MFRVINGYTVIASTALPGEGNGTVILGVRCRNVNADDYEYVVAEVEKFEDSSTWPQGEYSLTLDLALARFNKRVNEGRTRDGGEIVHMDTVPYLVKGGKITRL
jgi:hypothetical protein